MITNTPEPGEDTANCLLVIDHREARVFRSTEHGAKPEHVLPPDSELPFRHHTSITFAKGKETPDPNSYFKPVVKALDAADKIIVFGTGTGTSSEMEQFMKWLGIHHPGVAGRVVGAEKVNEHHLTEDQLLAKARDRFTKTESGPAQP